MLEGSKTPKNPLKIWKNPQIRSQNRRIFRSEKISYDFSMSDTPLETLSTRPNSYFLIKKYVYGIILDREYLIEIFH